MAAAGFRDPRVLARFAQGAIAVAALLAPFRATASRAYHLHPGSATLHRTGLVSTLFADATIVAVLLFLPWFSRCRWNACLFAPETFRWRESSIVVTWLVPVVTCWLPGRMLLDIHRASSGEEAAGRGTGLVKAWWAAWAGYWVVSGLSFLTGQGDTLAVIALSQALNIAAAVLVVLVIERITTVQRARAHHLTARSPVLPKPAGVRTPPPGPRPHGPGSRPPAVRRTVARRRP